ncbi:hypothetical protein ACP4OV_018591 [Aristida adscensionis]
MSEDGKAAVKLAVESLVAEGCTSIRDGLLEAAKVLDGRRHSNAVSSVILLSDGQDNCTMGCRGVSHGDGSEGHTATDYDVLVPPSLARAAGDRSAPVHAIGFGTDHDAKAMHAVSELTGGTFSFVENQEAVQDSFAQCVAGLLSVVAQKARVAVECLDAGVRVRAVSSGRYQSRVDEDGRATTVDVGDLYADEERRFLLSVDVPRVRAGAAYLDTATGQTVDVAGGDAVVSRRPEAAPCVEVARERARVEAAADIAAAHAAAERGDYGEAARILEGLREAVPRSPAALAGDGMCAALASELGELGQRVSEQREYEQTGRACVLAGLSSHAQQRASSVHLSCPRAAHRGPSAFATPAMRRMVKMSEAARGQQQPAPESGSKGRASSRRAKVASAAVARVNLLRKYRRLLLKR